MHVSNANVARFDFELERILSRYQKQPGDPELIVSACYELNIRSFHESCAQIALLHEDQWDRLHDVTYEFILASGLNRAHVLEDIANHLSTSSASNDPLVLRNIALIQYYLEDDEKSLSNLDRALSVKNFKPDSRTYVVFALIYYAREEFEACIEACDLAIDAGGPSARAVRLKGLSYFELGNLDESEKALNQALEQEPYFVWACHSLAEIALERGDLALAVRHFGKAIYINPTDPGNYFIPAEAFMDMNQPDLALAELRKLLLFKPDARIASEAHNGLGYLYLHNGDLAAAETELRLALSLESELGVAHYNLGRLELMRDRAKQAERHFKNAIECDETSGESWVELGFIALNNNQWKKAKRCFDKAIDLQVSEAQAYMGLARIDKERKDYASQLFHARKAMEIAPGDADVCNELGIALECSELGLEAVAAYENALTIDPDHQKSANNLGYLCESLLAKADASQSWQKKAIAAWKKRLFICLRLKTSTRTATLHLKKLGVEASEVRKWIKGAK